MIKKILTVLIVCILCGCTNVNDNSPTKVTPTPNEVTPTPTNDAVENFKVTHTGTIKILDKQIEFELYGEVAPITVENFVKLVNEGFYNGLTFHRIIKDFMIQGGDPEGTGMGGSDQTIKGEFSSNNVENSISHLPGVLSMARSSLPDSASSQFFICHGDASFLDGEYAGFGKVTSGLEVVDEIANMETDSNDRPLKDVVIESITIN